MSELTAGYVVTAVVALVLLEAAFGEAVELATVVLDVWQEIEVEPRARLVVATYPQEVKADCFTVGVLEVAFRDNVLRLLRESKINSELLLEGHFCRVRNLDVEFFFIHGLLALYLSLRGNVVGAADPKLGFKTGDSFFFSVSLFFK